MKALLNWLDQRTGYRQSLHEALYENIPGGARWRYVFGSMLVFAFITQAITGIFLWMFYSAGSQNAWESVYYIQYELQGGWLLRGVHHYMAQMMVVLLPIHMVQVILARAYQAPREVNYWLGLILMMIVLALGLTGYLLPWDQKGYWATKVATELMSLPPGGGALQRMVVGGEEYGHATLTRFFALHAGVLPALLVFFLGLHIAMFRRHGVTAPAGSQRPDEYFWPGQVFKDAIACFLMLGFVVALVCFEGAELSAPAQPTESYGAARPEWYFLFLFQLLKKFESEFVGAIIVPTAVMAFLFAMPLVAKVKFGHIVNVVVILVLVITAGYLTYEALDHDYYAIRHPEAPANSSAELHEARTRASEKFLESKESAEKDFERIRELIEHYGIPREGAVTLLFNDPEKQGPRLFAQHCASCHSYLNEEGEGVPATEQSAPNLYAIGTENWYRKHILSADENHGFGSDVMFGKTAHAEGEMVEFVNSDLAEMDEARQAIINPLIQLLAAESQRVDSPQLSDEQREGGVAALQETIDSYACTDCHHYRELGDLGSAPDLTGIYTYQWLYDFIADPTHERFYGENNDRMPSFQESLTPREIDLLVRWLRSDDKDLSLKAPASAETEPASETEETKSED